MSEAQKIPRRTFTAGALALAAAPGPVRAQGPGRTYRIAVWNTTRSLSDLRDDGLPTYRAFFGELRRLGFAEGRNLIVDRYGNEGGPQDYEPTARAIVRSRPDVVISGGGTGAQLVTRLAPGTPIVVQAVGDPVSSGLVRSLARPGENITGFTLDGGMEIGGLRIQMLNEVVPSLARVAFLTAVSVNMTPADKAAIPSLEQAAQQFGIELNVYPMAGTFDEKSYRATFAEFARQRVDGLYVGVAAEHLANRNLIASLAAEARVPAVYSYREYVDAGGLMSYGVNLVDNYRKSAGYVARILNGENPGDLPVQQPTRFDLIVNMKTAKALGIEIPFLVLARADEVLE